MVYNENHLRVNITETKAKLSALIRLAHQGKRITICRRNVPIAELTPLNRAFWKGKL